MILGHFEIALDHCVFPFGYIQVDFQKTLIFPIDFNDFIKLWGQLGVTLESLLVYEGGLGGT